MSIAGNAISYTLTRWEKLTRFIEHPVIELSTNWAENSMRPIGIGRKNWLHIGSKDQTLRGFDAVRFQKFYGALSRQMASILVGRAQLQRRNPFAVALQF